MTHVLIHGLRRSGTTILWETLRSDRSLRCYDEPFHPRFTAGQRDNHKGTWTELAEDVSKLLVQPVPIHPLDELDCGSSQAQIDWLAALMAARDRVVIDLVRCWNRMPTLVAGSDDVINVQILRDPANWAAAQLVPTAPPSIKRRLTNLYRRETFFSRKGYYDGYQYQQIIEAAINRDHPLFRFSRPTVDELRRAPAYIRLLAFWWGANTTLARSLMAANQTYVAVSLSEFSTNPKQQIARIAAAAGWSNTHVDVGAVRVARESFGTTSPLWKSAAQWLAIPVDIVTEGGGTAARMVDAFRRAEQY